jgi:predicted dehydrogenase
VTVKNVAVIGVGYWGKNIARSFSELGHLAAVVDANPAQARQVGDTLNCAMQDLRQVWTNPDIKGVAIATRAETHFDVAQAAIAAGKHVFVEKPLVLNESHADALIENAKAAGRALMVGHLLRYHPLFRKMLEIVKSGEHGRLRHVTSDRMSLGKIRTEENVLWSFAPHDISMVLALAGGEPETVMAQGSAFVNSGIADIASMQMRFAGGVTADIRASWINHKKLQQCIAVCDRASIVFEDSEKDWNRKLSIHPHEVITENGLPVPRRGNAIYIEIPEAEPLKEECRHFLDCINGAQPLTNGAEGRAVLRVLQRATESMRGWDAKTDV